MPQQIAAIIAALNSAHQQQCQFDEEELVDTEIVNRWIKVAPLDKDIAENLLLKGDFEDEIENRNLLAHISTVLAYLQGLQNEQGALQRHDSGVRDPIEGEIIPPEQLALTRKKFW